MIGELLDQSAMQRDTLPCMSCHRRLPAEQIISRRQYFMPGGGPVGVRPDSTIGGSHREMYTPPPKTSYTHSRVCEPAYPSYRPPPINEQSYSVLQTPMVRSMRQPSRYESPSKVYDGFGGGGPRYETDFFNTKSARVEPQYHLQTCSNNRADFFTNPPRAR